MVVNPGWMQIADTILVLVSTCGITFAMFGRFHEKPGVDVLLRSLLALVSFVVMFHPDTKVSAAVAIPVVVALVLGIWRHRIIAPPKSAARRRTRPSPPRSLLRCSPRRSGRWGEQRQDVPSQGASRASLA